MYDIIGDIHGYATPLHHLLARMDYQQIDGVWQHPTRKAIFLGDFVDRGPEQVQTVDTVRAMVEHGHALAVMGNHEFNAVAWATEHPNKPGEYLRPHNPKNLQQHQEFLKQVGDGSERHLEMLEWFKTLPLFLELDGIRIIHACWHQPSLQILSTFMDEATRLRPDAWVSVTERKSEPYEALETILKGLEIPLPQGHEFRDKDNNPRRKIRTQWWKTNYLTYRDIAEVPPEVMALIPHDPVPADLMPGYQGDKLLFVGHYWRTGIPAPLSEHIACLDYSIAASKPMKQQQSATPETSADTSATGKLCAYRYNGESTLDPAAFVWVTET